MKHKRGIFVVLDLILLITNLAERTGAPQAEFDLDERVEGLLLMVLGDDLHQEGVLALGQLDEGADAVDVGVDFDVEGVVFSWRRRRQTERRV